MRRNDWYQSLLEDVSSTLSEAVFTSRWALIEGYHEVGKRLRQEDKNAPMTELVNSCAEDMQVSGRKLWYAVQFYDQYPDINQLPEGKNISWSKIKTKYLPSSKKEKQEVEQELCPTCNRPL